MKELTPLIDGDILQYETAFAVEARWRYAQEEQGFSTEEPAPSDWLAERIEEQMAYILNEIGTEKEPILFFTGKTNFRNDIATSKKYKDREGARPFHYNNAKAVLKNKWESFEREGLEADDLIAIWMTKYPDKSICVSRDKDLLQVEGWHYQWENNKQPSFGPLLVEGYGKIWVDKGTLRGYGSKFFLGQCIIGDPTDTIPGLPRKGPAAAFKALGDTNTYEEGLKAVQSLYEATIGDRWEDYLTEQGRLLWMTRELDSNKQPVLWGF